MTIYYKYAFFFFVLIMCIRSSKGQDTKYQYLSGTDKDHAVMWDFYINTGMKSGAWDHIPVPSNWELQGFGTYNYFTDTKNPGETGQYKYRFRLSPESKGKTIFIVFEGSMTETEVKINGRSAGPAHQGGFYRFKYNITNLLDLSGENLLEVSVKKQTGNASVNHAERRADFWQFGGIFRPVYLEIVPPVYLDHMNIDAKADGALSVNVYPVNAGAGQNIIASVQNIDGKQVGVPFSTKMNSGQNSVTLKQQIDHIKTWDPEFPNLYCLVVSVTDNRGQVTHRLKQRFGFRTAELRPHDGFYVNNKKVIFKGVCRHSEWPESGRTLSKDISLMDVKLMKEMNMNAVRMSHYPPDQHFLEVCDSLGLFVLDELTGWQAKYDTIVGRKLVKEMVIRDVNHPSIVIWDNGNEGGWNTALDGEYAKYDPQKRLVIHPWEKFNGTDTKHYPDYNYVENAVLYGDDVFFPTEFMHGNYDGGSGTALDDYWTLMLKHPFFAGGFLWSFSDEAVVRVDQNGKMDTANDGAPDGVLGPHREKEGSFFTIKEIWSPVVINDKHIAPGFDGRLSIENHYLYTDLSQCHFTWRLVSFASPSAKNADQWVNAQGTARPIPLPPGERGFLDLNLPTDWQKSDALYLTGTDTYGKEIFTWTWAITRPMDITGRALKTRVETPVISRSEDRSLIVIVNRISYFFNTQTGYLANVVNNGTTISLSDGPVLAGVDLSLKSFNYSRSGSGIVVQSTYTGAHGWLNTKWIFEPGKAVKLEYQYSQKGEADFMGITFKYPEDKITGMKWLGRGPYHVWKNRLKGQQFGVWNKAYNNTITGETWNYPEFKGYHSEVYWVTIQNKESNFTVYTDDDNLFFQMLRPDYSKYAHESLRAAFPEGNIGFLNAISPMGTRFQQPALLGPQSQKNIQLNYEPVSGSLWFDFN